MKKMMKMMNKYQGVRHSGGKLLKNPTGAQNGQKTRIKN
jgi:hypothetical protein